MLSLGSVVTAVVKKINQLFVPDKEYVCYCRGGDPHFKYHHPDGCALNAFAFRQVTKPGVTCRDAHLEPIEKGEWE